MKYIPPFGATDQNAPYINGIPGTQKGSALPAEAIEHPQREILHCIAQAGLTPSKDDLTQLWKAIKSMIDGKTVDLSGYVPTTRKINTTYPLVGGGALSGNLTLDIVANDAMTAIGNAASVDFTAFATSAVWQYAPGMTNGPVTLTNIPVIFQKTAANAGTVYPLKGGNIGKKYTMTGGTWSDTPGGIRYAKVVYTAAGTYTFIEPGTGSLEIIATGAGASGGSGGKQNGTPQGEAGEGGASGGTGIVVINATGASRSVKVGAGGAALVNQTARTVPGKAGAASSYASLMTAQGGKASTRSGHIVIPGAGGIVSGADIAIPGGPSTAYRAGLNNDGYGGMGTPSFWGAGGHGGLAAVGGGSDGVAPGSGGGGGGSSSTAEPQAYYNSGAGADGIVIITIRGL